MIKFRQDAPKGSLFGVGAFEHQIGTTIPFKIGEAEHQGTLVDVRTSLTGRYAIFTVDLPDVIFPPFSLDSVSLVKDPRHE